MSETSTQKHTVDIKGKKKCDQSPIEHAIMELIAEHDFDGYLLTHFDCKIVKELPGDMQTAALIYQNGRFFIRAVEKFFNSLTDDERVAVMKHEIAHFIMKHMTRRNGRDPYLFNISADMAINQNIPHMPKSSVELPYGWKSHLSMEEYYDKLLKKVKQNGGCQGCQQASGGKKPGDNSGDDQSDNQSKGKGKELQLPKQFDDVQDASDSEAGDAESMTDEVIKEVVKQQLDSGVDPKQLRGLHAGALEEYIEELTQPPLIDWKHALSRFAATLADQHSRRTLKRPDRRELGPWGRKKEYLPSLVVVVDSSGSVSSEMLSSFFSQINLLGRMLSIVNVIIADAKVQEHFTYRPGMEEKLREAGSGRGGTDFDPAVQYINQNLRDCDGAIYLTDGWCPEPETRCKIPMIWVVTENEDYPGKPRIMAREPKRRS